MSKRSALAIAASEFLLLLAALAISQSSNRLSTRSFSDPANVSPPPVQAIGFPSRDPGFDAWPGFQSPPPGYGEVAFFWWLGDPLTKERLTWHLDQLAGKGISGLQINYAHTDRGGVSYGLSMKSDPPIFSPAWWGLVQWFAGEAGKRGMSISLSDYTLGLGQGQAMDAAIAEVPDLVGSQLGQETKTVAAGQDVDWTLPADWISVSACPTESTRKDDGAPIDLRDKVRDGRLRWRAPAGKWIVIAVYSRKVRPSLDPTHPEAGRAYIKHFFAPFEKYLPGQGGKALNFFFSDELEFRLPGFIWSERLAAEFQKRKGYDPRPLTAALFVDIGPRTPKVRMDYNDVRVALSEENFFRSVFDWHQTRGMIYGCDHGGRGLDVAEFGDYFRTQRWNQGPGSDQPVLEKNLIKAKVAASIAHLYERPRVWLEGYHSSGWGTTTADVAEATFADFLMGYNLLSFHGLYYSTHGGWWEWAPPDNHWRMPYWGHMDGFMGAVRRLSFLMAQGRHVCDVAVFYPVAPVEAGMDGQKAVEAAFGAGRALYGAGIDFDFMDFESVLRAKIEGGALSVAGEKYRVLILPAMRAIRFEALKKAAALAKAGGIVIAVGALPEASERAGRNDQELDRIVRATFELTAGQAAVIGEPHVRLGENGGATAVVTKAEDVVRIIEKVVGRDISYERAGSEGKAEQPGKAMKVPNAPGSPAYFQHRQIGPRDVYGFYGMPKGMSVRLRASGAVELWDPWTGTAKPLAVEEQDAAGTLLRLPLGATEIQLIVFRPGRAEIEEKAAAAELKPEVMKLDGLWSIELKPTLDNRWGDFRWPPRPGFIGAEARRVRYQMEDAAHPEWRDPRYDDPSRPRQTVSFGTMFWRLGPLSAEKGGSKLETRLAKLSELDPSLPVRVGDVELRWKPYDFSWRWGVEDDPGHQGYHGLKEEVSGEFIRLGKPKRESTAISREKEDGGSVYYLWTTVAAPGKTIGRIMAGGMKPAAVWVRGRAVVGLDSPVELEKGANPVLVRYDQPGTGWFLFVGSDFVAPAAQPGPLAMRWVGAPGIFPFDIHPGNTLPAGWYRFRAAPGLKALTVTAIGEVEAWADGRPLRIASEEAASGGAKRVRFALPEIIRGEALIALRVVHVRGLYGGAALPVPVEFECGEGRLEAGDWSTHEGLESYSGGIRYKRPITLPEIIGDDASCPSFSEKRDRMRRPPFNVTLDLGGASSSAEVFVNGRSAGVRVAPPWRWDIGTLVRAGGNLLEVLVFNTLSNHYSTIPTRYRGNPISGLLGPARLIHDKLSPKRR